MIRLLGKHAPRLDPLADASLLKLAPQHLVAEKLPSLPAAKNWSEDVPPDRDPLGNTELGDCTVAAIGHLITCALALLGQPSPVTADEIKRIYLTLTGGADSGLYLRDVLDYAAREGVCGVKLIYAGVNWRDRAMLATASGLFGGVIVGAAMPVEAQTQDIWDVVPGMQPGSWGGHAIFRPGHSPALGNFNSWGEGHDATDGWEGACVDEAYACLIEGAPAPSGLNLEALRADLALLE